MPSSPITALSVAAGYPDASPPAVTEDEASGLLRALSRVPDPRDHRGVRYPMTGLLAVTVCAVLAGASSFAGGDIPRPFLRCCRRVLQESEPVAVRPASAPWP
ncbi:transposase family protein [Micromonospora sediminimaris]|uniref:H repeat-associated protein N-terminal domain-containing protein n=1 Tax=Micromonospora sediminimaris TaxID=547162 RepID=A0A9W5UTK4_9ACTN|nr:transposase family protein [Micromonospora sediminimaris]GIJ34801.1 hypothetical protein Vse01_39490 [Micromonospora sediminimaris]